MAEESEDGSVSPSEREAKQNDLAAAVAAEDYVAAASLRDELASMVVDDQMAVTSVNTAFYSAFTAGSYEQMAEVWADDAVTCIHPGSPPLYGRDDVMESWKQILASARMEIKADKVRCALIGSTAIVTCHEVVDGASPLVATNVFARTVSGTWRMVLHQAGAMMQTTDVMSPEVEI